MTGNFESNSNCRESILIMDDEADIRETTGNVLRRLGYNVACAADGQEAVDLYRKAKEGGKPFDLVIMDLTVPGGMGGQEAFRKLFEIDPQVKAIVSSGYSSDPVLSDYRSYGFSGIVAKPFRLKDLTEEVKRVLNSGPG
jgi:two-component system cell cycle sensor histidine kinase/response regulator CckA